MNLIVLVGIPGSGKSHYAKKYVKDNPEAVHIASDKIREELHGTPLDCKHNKETFQVMRERTVEALKAGKDVLYDATNIKAADRKRVLEAIKDIEGCTASAVFFKVPLRICLERNNSRARKVPRRAICTMRSKVEPPTEEEGFASIRFIYK